MGKLLKLIALIVHQRQPQQQSNLFPTEQLKIQHFPLSRPFFSHLVEKAAPWRMHCNDQLTLFEANHAAGQFQLIIPFTSGKEVFLLSFPLILRLISDNPTLYPPINLFLYNHLL